MTQITTCKQKNNAYMYMYKVMYVITMIIKKKHLSFLTFPPEMEAGYPLEH